MNRATCTWDVGGKRCGSTDIAVEGDCEPICYEHVDAWSDARRAEREAISLLYVTKSGLQAQRSAP